MSYFLVYYIRSYRYLFPVCAYVGILLFIYTVTPNPIMDSYAFTSMLLFLVSSWISYGFVDLEHEAQRLVTLGRAGSMAKYGTAQYLVVLGIGAVMGLLAVCYPIAFDKFDRVPMVEEVFVAVAAHLVLASLGASCSLLFSDRFIASRTTAFFGLALTLAISCGSIGLYGRLPQGARELLWLLPPASRVTELLVRYEELSRAWIAFIFIFSTFYTGMMLLIYIRRSGSKMF